MEPSTLTTSAAGWKMTTLGVHILKISLHQAKLSYLIFFLALPQNGTITPKRLKKLLFFAVKDCSWYQGSVLLGFKVKIFLHLATWKLRIYCTHVISQFILRGAHCTRSHIFDNVTRAPTVQEVSIIPRSEPADQPELAHSYKTYARIGVVTANVAQSEHSAHGV